MNSKSILASVMAAMISLLAVVAMADAKVGATAPAFKKTDINGQAQTLDQYKGKWVVLEWFNKDCPYVKKHYGSHNMQDLQKTYTGKNVVWLTVLSSAKNEQGYLTPAEAQKVFKDNGSVATAVVLDADGTLGKAYGAKTTPHMFVINPQGTLIYNGAIDDNDSSDPKVIAKSKNYVKLALDAGMAGQPVPVATSKPYGCSVKY